MPDPLYQNRPTSNASRGRPFAWLLLLAITGAALAGCLAVDTDTQSEDRGGDAPVARLESDRDTRWAREAFTLDARGSNLAGMELTRWQIEAGDGTVYEGDNLTEAIVQHAYDHGGVYEARLNLTGTPTTGGNLTVEATKTLVVDERRQIEQETLYAAPVEDAPTARLAHTFDVGENSTQWEADLRLENPGVFPESEVTVRVLDADNETLHEENVTLGAEENTTLRLAGNSTGAGTYTLEILVETGSIESSGETRVYYAPSDQEA